ncbi:MAG: serine/threonine-protein kinase [Isosphaeraceae bacterium]
MAAPLRDDPAQTVDLASVGPGSGGGRPLKPGKQVRYFGDYEILEELGRGGMGVVYRARQVSLNRPVALKMIRSGVLADADELRRFQNEVEAVALLDHPGVVPVYEVGELDGQRYFSMKLIDGGCITSRLETYRDDPRAAARLVAEAAEAVAHAHARGVLHRDLKPANLLIDAAGHPHVTDFGLAKRISDDAEMTQTGAILGTPAYMSPEQAAGRRGAITTATDVYGLGAVLYSLLSGKAPFAGATVIETLDAVRTSSPEGPRRLNPRVPRDLETVCLKCLEKEPGRRYATAQALAADLRAWLDNRPIAARPAGTIEQAVLFARAGRRRRSPTGWPQRSWSWSASAGRSPGFGGPPNGRAPRRKPRGSRRSRPEARRKRHAPGWRPSNTGGRSSGPPGVARRRRHRGGRPARGHATGPARVGVALRPVALPS